MSLDIYGYNKVTKSGNELMTSDIATISFGGGERKLMQSVQAQYRNDVQETYEIGSADIYLQAGNSVGSIQAQRVVGTAGFLDGIDASDCGEIGTVSISFGGGGHTCRAQNAPGSTLKYSGVRLANYGVSFQAGPGNNVMESFEMRVAHLEQGGGGGFGGVRGSPGIGR